MLELSNLCHCVQYPWKLTSRDFWSSRKTGKPLSQLKHVFRKCSGVSQKWWVLALSNLFHCIQHPWKLTSRDFWSSRNKENHFLSENVFWENGVGYLRNSDCWSFQTFAIVFSTPEKLLIGISRALGMQESHFLCKNMCWENGVGISETVNAKAFKPLPLCSAPLKTY